LLKPQFTVKACAKGSNEHDEVKEFDPNEFRTCDHLSIQNVNKVWAYRDLTP